MVKDCTVILDGTDNLKTRKILNRASILKDIPFVYGGVEGFTGMATTFVPGRTPCLECFFSRDTGQKRTYRHYRTRSRSDRLHTKHGSDQAHSGNRQTVDK